MISDKENQKLAMIRNICFTLENLLLFGNRNYKVLLKYNKLLFRCGININRCNLFGTVNYDILLCMISISLFIDFCPANLNTFNT